MSESWFQKNFVWVSSTESIAARKTSILAIAEMLIGVTAYWGYAWYAGTLTHIFLSVLVAPLLLIRTEKSVALGNEWFVKYWSDRNEISPKSVRFWLIVGGGFCVSGIIAWLLASLWLVDQTGIVLFFRVFAVGFIAMSVGIAVAGALAGALAVAVAGAGALAVAGALAGAGALAVAGALAGAVVLRAIFTRILASLFDVFNGMINIPTMWQHHVLVTDSRVSPQLLPDLDKHEPELSLRGLWKEILESAKNDRRWTLSLVFMGICLFIPPILYRLSIKSTCWLYLPIIYLLRVPAVYPTAAERLEWVKTAPTYKLEWARIGMALVTLVCAIIAFVDWIGVIDQIAYAKATQTMLTPLNALFLLDTSLIRPWHYLGITTAFITLYLFFYIDVPCKHIKAGFDVDGMGWQVATLLHLYRFRALLSLLWMGMALYYFVFATYLQCAPPFDPMGINLPVCDIPLL